jgi:uncharacterized membrane protein YsdA (DUF1294 family)
MKYKKNISLVLLVIFIIFFIFVCITLDQYFTNQGDDRVTVKSKMCFIFFIVGVPSAICANIYFIHRNKKR